MSKQAKYWFSGHKDSIEDFQLSPELSFLGPNHLLTGSSDKTSRLFDIRTQKNVKGIIGFKDSVSSVQFNGSSSIPHVYLSSGNELFTYDLRNTGLIYSEPLQSLDVGEEVNSITMNTSNSALAIATDKGELRTFKCNQSGLKSDKVKQAHEMIAMDIKFIGDKCTQVITGGYDNYLRIWDLNKVKPIESFNMAEYYELGSKGNGTNQMINPPFVNSIQMTSDTKQIFCASGDGAIKLFYKHIPPKAHKAQWTCYNIPDAHNYTITNIELVEKEDCNMIVSSGNDKKVKVWKFIKKPSPKTEVFETLVDSFEVDPIIKFNCMRVVDDSLSSILCTGISKDKSKEFGIGLFELN